MKWVSGRHSLLNCHSITVVVVVDSSGHVREERLLSSRHGIWRQSESVVLLVRHVVLLLCFKEVVDLLGTPYVQLGLVVVVDLLVSQTSTSCSVSRLLVLVAAAALSILFFALLVRVNQVVAFVLVVSEPLSYLLVQVCTAQYSFERPVHSLLRAIGSLTPFLAPLLLVVLVHVLVVQRSSCGQVGGCRPPVAPERCTPNSASSRVVVLSWGLLVHEGIGATSI